MFLLFQIQTYENMYSRKYVNIWFWEILTKILFRKKEHFFLKTNVSKLIFLYLQERFNRFKEIHWNY